MGPEEDVRRGQGSDNAARPEADLWRAAFDSMLDMVVIVRPDGTILQCNRAFADFVGRDAGTLAGEKCFRLVPATEGCVEDCPIPRALRSGARETVEMSVGARTFHFVADPIREGGGEIVAFVHIMRDITETKRIEQALSASEERYRALVEKSLQGLLVVDDFRIVYANARCEEIAGYAVEELLALPLEKVTELVHPDDRAFVWGRFRERLGGKEVSPRYQYRILRKDGAVRWLEMWAAPIEYRGRRAIQAAIVDITDARKSQEEIASLQEQFRQAQKMEAIGRLAGGVAHDFNNLLTVIEGTCQLSLRDLPESDPMRQSFEQIMEASDRAAALTRQLLAFGRRQVMEVRVIDLNRVLEGLDKMLRRIIGEDIELVAFLQDGIGMVRADPGQIEQAIINIVVNARDAMPGGGKLTIETANVYLDEEYVRLHHGVQPGPHVMVSISDTGAGMTPGVKEHVFEPFFSTKEGGKGTGLGLSTVYGIVKQSRGSVWVYSEPGRGTTFKIYLPRVYAPADAAKERPSGEVPRGSETVLVVEDEEGVRKLAVRVLAQQGYKTLEAADGAGALALCGEYKEPVDLILTDVVMPGMSGRETAERLRTIHPEAKVLYMSGYTDNVIVHHGVLQEGMKFLHKPFTAEGLARKVREVLDE